MAEVSKFVRIERPLGDDTNAREMLLLSDQWIRLVDRRTANEGLITVGLDISAMKRQEVILQRSETAPAHNGDRTRTHPRPGAGTCAQQLPNRKTEPSAPARPRAYFLANMSHELRTPLKPSTASPK